MHFLFLILFLFCPGLLSPLMLLNPCQYCDFFSGLSPHPDASPVYHVPSPTHLIFKALVFGVLVFPFCGIPPEPTDQKSYSLGLARACRQTSTNTISFHNGPFHIVKEFTVCVHERVCLRVRVHSCTCAYTDVGACACSQCLAVCRDVNFSSSQLQSKCFHDHTATFAAPTYETAICSPAHHSDKHSCIFPFAFEFVYFILFQVGLLMYPRLTP